MKMDRSIKDQESLNSKTEEALLNPSSSSSGSSDTNSIASKYRMNKKKQRYCRCNWCLITGIFLTTLGFFLLLCTPYEIILNERLKMIPGFPCFNWWVVPPDTILLKAYVFNYTNWQEFLEGTADKLQVEEIGPIVYREKLEHFNVTHNKNSTLSFITKRTAIYLPEMNHIDLNTTITIPNYAVLGMASFLYDSSFFTKLGFNILLRSVGSPLFINTTIYNFLWNITDPALAAGQKIFPSLVPFLNIGILERIYDDFTDGSTVFIGKEHGDEKFFLIDKYHGTPYLFEDDDGCDDQVAGSTEGTLYPQLNTNKSVLKYWRKTICRVIPLYYERKLFCDYHQVETYKYTVQPDAYDRKDNLSTDCYTGKPVMTSGLSDVSKCYHNIPMAASFPHFIYGSEELKEEISGLKPNKTQHDSYVIIEPVTGIPIESFARSQNNLIVRKLSGFNPTLNRFSEKILPMFWLEYSQEYLPDYISNLMYFTVVAVPKYQYYFISFIITIGAVIIFIELRKYLIKNTHKKDILRYKNQNITFETQKFIKR